VLERGVCPLPDRALQPQIQAASCHPVRSRAKGLTRDMKDVVEFHFSK
jgi:hypothetical protein